MSGNSLLLVFPFFKNVESTLGSWATQKQTGAVPCGRHAAVRPTSKFQPKAGGSLPEPSPQVEDTFGDELLHVKAWRSGQSRGTGTRAALPEPPWEEGHGRSEVGKEGAVAPPPSPGSQHSSGGRSLNTWASGE